MGKNGIRFFLALWVLVFGVGITGTAAYAAEELTAEIPVEILLEGNLPEEAERFRVELKPESKAFPMPEGSKDGVYQLKLTGASEGNIRIPCDRLGVFEYTIRLVPGDDPDCSYDSREYDLTVFVASGENGVRTVSVMVYGPDECKRDKVTFRNVYGFPADVVITAIKTLDGRTPKDGAFSFRLLDEKGNEVDTAKNEGQAVTFDPLVFDQAGTYRYFLKENAGKDKHIRYDRTVYTITVEVTKDVDYHAEVTMLRNEKAYTGTPVFANETLTEGPRTGDSIGIYFTVLTLSAAALSLLFAFRRRR